MSAEYCPGAEAAVVPDGKLWFLLEAGPEVNSGKTPCFTSLGFNASNAEDLRQQLLTQLPQVPKSSSRTNKGGGMSYTVRHDADWAGGSADFQAVWSTASGETAFVTAYPWREKRGTTTLANDYRYRIGGIHTA